MTLIIKRRTGGLVNLPELLDTGFSCQQYTLYLKDVEVINTIGVKTSVRESLKKSPVSFCLF